MSRKKSERDAAVEKIIDLLAEHIEETMSPEQARALSADFKSFSQQLRRATPREEPSRSSRSAKKAAPRRGKRTRARRL
jgi:glutamate synthase domain-containing protein 3